MHLPRYALIAYVHGPVAQFVENLRRELHPELPHMPAHVTILPPRCINIAEADAIRNLEEICAGVEPFEVTLGEVETFIPVTPTLFIRVAHAAARMQELHDQLNHGAFEFMEQWPYTPHLTIAKMTTEKQAFSGVDTARRRWLEYGGSRRIPLEKLTFVREAPPNCWADLAPVHLGSKLVSRSS
jgi:2'-5' RNA ligase